MAHEWRNKKANITSVRNLKKRRNVQPCAEIEVASGYKNINKMHVYQIITVIIDAHYNLSMF